MHRYLLFLLLIVIGKWSQAQIPEGYYDGTEGLTSFYLKQKLHQIIAAHNVSWHYGDLPEWYELTDRDSFYEVDGTMLDLYAENPEGPDPYNYTYEEFSLISGASEEGLGWNREHIVSQSFFYGKYPMYSDLHFVIPTDARVNQRRSNYPFAEVGTSPTFESLNGSLVGLSASPGYTQTVFEPIDEFKGDIARMLMYVAVRYEDIIPFFDTTNSRNPFQARQEIALKPWQIDVLMSWHLADPVSDREIKRNNKNYDLQGNRNPFIDHPEWAASIWSTPVDDVAPQRPKYLSVVDKGKSFVTISWEETVEVDVLGFEMYQDDSLVGISKINKFTYTQLDPITEYSFTIKAYDAGYNKSLSSSVIVVSTEADDTFSSDLYFSKIIEGSGHNKAIEITNNTGYPVDLRRYTISKREINESTGSLYWSDNGYQMTGFLPHARKAVLVHPNWDLPCIDVADADFVTAGTPMMFDGKTALRLYRDGNGIDLFGSASDTIPFAVDASVYRKSEYREPRTSFDESEWTWNEIDYCEDLGNTDTTVSINPIPTQLEFNLHPNPVHSGERIHFTIPDHIHIEKLRLSDITGKMILEQPFAKSNDYIMIPLIASGWYILSFDQYNFKIIIVDSK